MWAKLERLIENVEYLILAIVVWWIGFAIGVGQLLAASALERPKWWVTLGRGFSTGGLAMSAGLMFLWVPFHDLSFLDMVLLIGAAAFIASMGTSKLEALLARFFERR